MFDMHEYTTYSFRILQAYQGSKSPLRLKQKAIWLNASPRCCRPLYKKRDTMKAIRINEFGGPEVMKIVEVKRPFLQQMRSW